MATTNNELEELYQLSNQLKSLSGRIEKEEFIAKHKDNEKWKSFLSSVLDSLKVYGIQSKKLNKALTQSNPLKHNFHSLSDVFSYLEQNNTGKDLDVQLVADYIQSQDSKYHEWLIESITKSFKMGVTAKTVNKALGEDLIFNFDVMLAHPFEKYAHKIKDETMYVTEKLDGIRATFIRENGKITGFSRQGKQLIGYEHIEEELLSILPKINLVFDGELLIKNEDNYKDREVMQQTNSIASSKGDKSQLSLHLYDIIDLHGFKLGKSKFKYKERRETLDNLNKIMEDVKHVYVLPLLYTGADLQEVSSILSQVEKEGKEGLMINLDGYYTLTRSNQILKMKTFSSFDEICTGVFEGESKYKGMLGGITVDYKGYPLSIGSGFTDEQRKLYWDNPEFIIGKIVEISFFRESKNKQGGLSVSFPVFELIRHEKTEPSYN